jgi:hypothetical protein
MGYGLDGGGATIYRERIIEGVSEVRNFPFSHARLDAGFLTIRRVPGAPLSGAL